MVQIIRYTRAIQFDGNGAVGVVVADHCPRLTKQPNSSDVLPILELKKVPP
jgi:hypothetical protein